VDNNTCYLPTKSTLLRYCWC